MLRQKPHVRFLEAFPVQAVGRCLPRPVRTSDTAPIGAEPRLHGYEKKNESPSGSVGRCRMIQGGRNERRTVDDDMQEAENVHMRLSTVVVVVAALALVGRSGPAPASGQTRSPEPRDESSRVDLSRLGPQVGERVPDFTLPDQAGQTWTLESLMGPNGAMLVFVRSADW